MGTKIGLALGGGGARGLAHIGVLKVLQKEKIPISCIVGCSSGAFVGAAYAVLGDAGKIENLASEWVQSPLFKEIGMQFFLDDVHFDKNHRLDDFFTYLKTRFSLIRALNNQAVLEREKIEVFFNIFEGIKIEKLPIHFSAIATDLISGQEVVLRKGNLKQAVLASSAIPGMFPPVKLGAKLLVDGATSDSIPAEVVRKNGADKVLAVDVSKCIRKIGPLTNALYILYRADEIATFHLTQKRLTEADLVIRPAVRQTSWANFKQIKKLIRLGEKAAQEKLPEIRGWLEK